ncbi:hypothetical protein EDD22DRAFT_965115 [Suillus occidentalis]|nr:hypothetical protein EDD22DRAFT_965115 [Suillus occidentalis]
MGSSSSLDLSTSSLPDVLSPPTPKPRLQLQMLHKCLIRQHPIPFFISSFPRILPPNHGKHARAKRIVSRTLLYNHALTRAPLSILRHALITTSPAVKCISQKRLGKNVQNKSGKRVEERLAREIIAVVNGDSKAIADKELANKQAMVNRGNALVK